MKPLFEQVQSLFSAASNSQDPGNETLEGTAEVYEKLRKLFEKITHNLEKNSLSREEEVPPPIHLEPCDNRENLGGSGEDTEPPIDLDAPQIPTDTPGLEPKLSYWSEVTQIGLGCAGTLYFARKAYQAIGKLWEERHPQKEEKTQARAGGKLGEERRPRKKASENKETGPEEKKRSSCLPAVGYTAAAICSAAFTVFKWLNFDVKNCI